MAKSEAITACLPSTPEIPIPTSAVWIIETSLAPSPKNYQGVLKFIENSHEFVRRIPMPRVRMCSCCLTIFTINAFWSGVALQHKTAAQWRVKWRNGFCRFERLSSIYLCEFERRYEITFIMHLLSDCSTYNNVFPSTTKAFRLTTMLELSEAKGKKERSLFPVSLALAVMGEITI